MNLRLVAVEKSFPYNLHIFLSRNTRIGINSKVSFPYLLLTAFLFFSIAGGTNSLSLPLPYFRGASYITLPIPPLQVGQRESPCSPVVLKI